MTSQPNTPEAVRLRLKGVTPLSQHSAQLSDLPNLIVKAIKEISAHQASLGSAGKGQGRLGPASQSLARRGQARGVLNTGVRHLHFATLASSRSAKANLGQ